MVKVSVIVPIYNIENYLDRCLNSLAKQTLSELEVILINDGSLDNSEEVVNKYLKSHSSLFHYYKKENGGLSDARNYGLKYASGEYIAFLDGDDYVEPDIYQLMYLKAKEQDYKIVECDYFYTYEDKEKYIKGRKYKSIKDYLVNGRVVAWNKLLKSEWLLTSNILFPKSLIYEDVEFFFKIVSKLGSIDELGYVHKGLIHYVQRSNSISYVETIRVLQIINIYENIIQYYQSVNKYDDYEKVIEYRFVRSVFCSFLKKAAHIKDKEVRKKVFSSFWSTVKTKFPKYKRNPYLYKRKSLVNLYLLLMNKLLYQFIYFFVRL